MINFGIIGCGYVSKRHAEHIRAHPEARLVGGYDAKPERTESFANANKVRNYASAAELLADDDIDIVTICTPNGDHHLSSIRALEAKKHVLVEKPMAIKKSFAEAMIQASLQHNRSLFVVKQNRFNPPVQAVKQLLDEGQLGRLFAVTVNCFWNRNEQYYTASDWKGTKDLDGGTLFTQFSHFVDIVYYLFGDIEVTHAQLSNVNHAGLIDFEDTGQVNFQLKQSGALGNLNYTTACYDKNMEGSITLFCENGTIKIGGKYLNTIDYQSTAGFDIGELPASNPANDYGYYEGSMSNHDKIIHNVVASLEGTEKIMTNAYEGLKVVEIIENIYSMAESV